MDSTLKKKTLEVYAATEDLYRKGQIDDDTYHKAIVCFAYEFIVGDEITLAAGLLVRPPLSYYNEVQPKQMAEDKQYSRVAVEVARALVKAGLVELGTRIRPTQQPASA